MAKLTGTNPDQVPTNADLGTMAYQDKDNVTLGELIADSYNETYSAVTSSSNATTVDCETANSFSHTLT